MKFSSKVLKCGLSPMRKFHPYAVAAEAKGKKIYHLNIGQPDIETPKAYFDAVKHFDLPVLAYAPSPGIPELIEAIRKYYADLDMHFDAGDILITNGGSEALIFAVMALCDPGDEIMVFEPFYANYTTFAREFGAKINAVQTNVTDGYHLPDAAAIEAQITPRTKAVLLTNPGNPTGVVYTQEEMDMISAIVRKYDLALIADEVYREFVYDGAYRSFGTMPELADNLIIIDSVSKRYSACGARIGCIISKNKELAKQIIKCCQGRLCSPILEQVGAAALYTTPVSYLEEVNQEYKKRRDTIVAALKELPGVVASDPKGAFYIMVQLPVDDAEKFAIWTLENFAIDNETVMFAPGNGFYSDPELGVNEARLAYVLNCDDLKKAIYILGEALKAYPGKTN